MKTLVSALLGAAALATSAPASAQDGIDPDAEIFIPHPPPRQFTSDDEPIWIDPRLVDAEGYGGYIDDPGAVPEFMAALYLRRIAEIDDAGPMLNAVIVTNPDAPELARAAGEARLRLGGRTVLVKDNIETREFTTTAGSLALAGNDTGRDAPLIARLRAAGGVVLGKTNLSEWANIRSSDSSSGWSAVGGQTRNPHAIDRNTCGSSSGSGAAVAAQLAWAAIGTETDGSITCPASVNGIVGFKPTVGLVSQELIVPISSSQDTAGPMATNVWSTALLLNAIAEPGEPDRDFTQGLYTSSLEGKRLGVLVNQTGGNAQVREVFSQALSDLASAGAVLVDVEYEPDRAMWDDEYTVLLYEFRVGLDAYLQASPADIPVRSLADVIAFNAANAETELRWFGQDIFELAAMATDEAEYLRARDNSRRLAGAEGIDRLLAEHDLEMLVVPTEGPAWPIDLVLGDHFMPGIGAGSLAAIVGYPHLTVPMGDVEGLPVGLSFIATAGEDAALLQAGAAYERARSVAISQPSLKPWSENP